MATTSRNDIFTSSWRATPPSVSPPQPDDPSFTTNTGSGNRQLGRSKTLGAAWRPYRDRTTRHNHPFPSVGEQHLFPTLHDDSGLTPRALPNELPIFMSTGGEEDQLIPGLRTKTTSFFDVPSRFQHPAATGPELPAPSPISASHDDIPISPTLSASTATLSHAGSSTHSASNPSLSAALPFAAKTGLASAVPVEQDPLLDVELRLFPRPEFLLGAGRYSNVYLAAYKPNRDERGKKHDGGAASEPDEEGSAPKWKLCAVKKLNEDEESQRLGLREAWFLRQLASSMSTPADGGSTPSDHQTAHPGQKHIAQLIGIKREEEHGRGHVHKSRASWSHSSLLHLALEGRKSAQGVRHSRHASLEDDLPPLYIPSAAGISSASHSLERELLLVLPYAPAVLSQVIHTRPRLLTPARYVKIALQLSQAVAFLHSQQILHTDIKPHNILLSSSFDVLLGDFNTAIHLPSTSTNNVSALPNAAAASTPVDPAGLGTPVYSPPEFNRPPPSPFSYPADIWALGVTLMVAIVGREPYGRLINGTRGKGGSGSRHLELKMWLKKGAYWQWEEQERVEALVDGKRLAEVDEDDTANDKRAIGRDQLKQLLGPDLPRDDPTRLQAESESPEIVQMDLSTPSSEDPYDDGSPALYYLGAPTIRVSQRIFGLLRRICTASQTARPSIEEIVKTFEEELEEL